MRKLVLLASFFSLTPVVIIVSCLLLLYTSFQQKNSQLSSLLFGHSTQPIAYAALPANLNVVEGIVGTSDARVGKVSTFLSSFNSPLVPYAQLMVDKADEYHIDYRLLPAIGAQESGACLKEITGTHNCWGYGIYGKKVTIFQSYPEAIDIIIKYFANKKARGIDTLDALGNIWNPSNSNDWKGKVTYFLNQL